MLLKKDFFNYFFTFISTIIPILVTILVYPRLIHFYGVETVGYISLLWLIIGYAGILDLGLSKALIVECSKFIREHQWLNVQTAFWTTVAISLVLSIVFCTATAVGFNLFSSSNSFYFLFSQEHLPLLLAFVPVVLLSSVITGFINANEEFWVLNIFKFLTGLLVAISPFICSLYLLGLKEIVYSLFYVRLGLLFLLVLYVFVRYRYLQQVKFNLSQLKILVNQGLWITVTNVVSPLIVNLDRFFLTKTHGLATVTYYGTVVDGLTKLNIIPNSVILVTFPRLSALSAKGNRQNLDVYLKPLNLISLATLPAIVVAFFSSKYLLTMWISAEFAENSDLYAKIILVGLLWNCMAQFPLSLLQAIGRSDLVGRTHFFELIFFLPILYFSLVHFGATGASVCWALRVFADHFVLNYLVGRQLEMNLFRNKVYIINLLVSILFILLIMFW